LHFGEHKRLHLESSKQNYYIIPLRAIIKSIFTRERERENFTLSFLNDGCKAIIIKREGVKGKER